MALTFLDSFLSKNNKHFFVRDRNVRLRVVVVVVIVIVVIVVVVVVVVVAVTTRVMSTEEGEIN